MAGVCSGATGPGGGAGSGRRVTQNWHARPLESHQVIGELIANTAATTGLKVQWPMDATHLELSAFHGAWNHVIHLPKPVLAYGAAAPHLPAVREDRARPGHRLFAGSVQSLRRWPMSAACGITQIRST